MFEWLKDITQESMFEWLRYHTRVQTVNPGLFIACHFGPQNIWAWTLL